MSGGNDFDSTDLDASLKNRLYEAVNPKLKDGQKRVGWLGRLGSIRLAIETCWVGRLRRSFAHGVRSTNTPNASFISWRACSSRRSLDDGDGTGFGMKNVVGCGAYRASSSWKCSPPRCKELRVYISSPLKGLKTPS